MGLGAPVVGDDGGWRDPPAGAQPGGNGALIHRIASRPKIAPKPVAVATRQPCLHTTPKFLPKDARSHLPNPRHAEDGMFAVLWC